MSDHLDRAAEVLWASIDDKGIRGRLFREDCDYLARVLADAGLLASSERDAAVAAKAWEKGFERGFYTGTSGTFGPDSDASEADVTNPYEPDDD